VARLLAVSVRPGRHGSSCRRLSGWRRLRVLRCVRPCRWHQHRTLFVTQGSSGCVATVRCPVPWACGRFPMQLGSAKAN